MHSPTPAFLTAQWRDLAMLSFEIEPEVLRPLVPRGCELDLWQGRALVSVVAFCFLDVRVRGVPVPFHRRFEEVNLRFYVRRAALSGEWRRGVVFVKELVPRRAVAWVARWAYSENYVALPMRSRGTGQKPGPIPRSIAYEWSRGGAWEGLALTVRGEPELPEADGEESFVTEHYWGYTRRPDGGTAEYQVEHPRWAVWRAEAAGLRCDAASLYGPGFAAALGKAPSSAFLAAGSPVVVRRPRLVEPAAS